jgi:hypothetical protein
MFEIANNAVAVAVSEAEAANVFPPNEAKGDWAKVTSPNTARSA